MNYKPLHHQHIVIYFKDDDNSGHPGDPTHFTVMPLACLRITTFHKTHKIT